MTLNLIERAKTLGDFAPSQDQVEKWQKTKENK